MTATLAKQTATGIVFVLLPGGETWMGATKDPAGPNPDPATKAHELEVHQVVLAPFFLSKYEMTQGQWARLTGGARPSSNKAGNKKYGLRVTDVHPVEAVSWTRCDQVMGWYGLCIPTEAQWEYGCRGGTDTPWYVGPDYKLLRGHVNFADRAAWKSGNEWSQAEDWEDLDDGYVIHAPVDALLANPFGLHHVCGNVWEYCRDFYLPYSNKITGPDGARAGTSKFRTMRGAAYDQNYKQARSAYRSGRAQDSPSSTIGLRPGRVIR